MTQYDGIDASTPSLAVLRKNAAFLKRRFFLTMPLASRAEARWLAGEITRAVR